MALFDLADPAIPLPTQLVVDSSLLLACRRGDDNPHAAAAQTFIGPLGQKIIDYQMIVWLLIPVLQECYHIILSHSLRRTWEGLAADVLYLSFRKPQRAKKTVEMDDNVLIRTDDDEVVGITILNASSRD